MSFKSCVIFQGRRSLPDPGIRVTLRPVCPLTDIVLIHAWMRYEYAGSLLAGKNTLRELEKCYTSMAESDFVRSYMCLINDIPACQVEICEARLHTISLHYNARAGDYGLRLLLAPFPLYDGTETLVNVCLQTFFAFPAVERIVLEAGAHQTWAQRLFRTPPFQTCRKIRIPAHHSTLHICTRRAYADVSF